MKKKILIIAIIVITVAGVNVAYYYLPSDLKATFLGGMKIFNFLLLAGGLFYILKDPAGRFFSSRSDDIQERLREAEKREAESREMMKKAEEKFDDLDKRVEEIREKAREEGEKEKEKLKKEAEKMAENILERTDKQIERRMESAREELTEYVVKLSLDIAKNKLSEELSKEDEDEIFEKALSRVEDEL